MRGSVSSIKPSQHFLRRERAKSLMDVAAYTEEQGRISSTTVTAASLTQKSKDTLARFLAEDSSVNKNNLLSGGAIRIQDLVRRLNGGLKLV